MDRRSKTAAKPLPPPTASEAAFERVLASFDNVTTASTRESAPLTIGALYARKDEFLARDAFAGIGERDAFPTKIVGVSFEGRQDTVAGLRAGVDLELRRCPENPVDSNAIAVHYGTLQLGFLRKQIARHLGPLIDGGARYRAHVEHVTGGREGKHFGVNIRVRRESEPSGAATSVSSRREHADRAQLRHALIGDSPLREAQRQVLERVDAGKNTLAVLGTGRGKSFCFQYPAAYRALESGQKTLVVYPLRALANDQFDALTRRLDGFGLRIFRANGSIGADERAALMGALESGQWDVMMATPEFLQFHRAAFGANSMPALAVVDEAHHTFESRHREAYGALGRTIASLGKPQVLGLTATAGDDAFAHVVRELGIEAWVIDPTVRENLHIVDARGTKDKAAYLRRIAAEGGKAIVYCNSRTAATKIAEDLRKTIGDAVLFYHAGMPSSERTWVESQFRSGALRIVVATSAFGEGIDLPDVRNVVLYHLNFDFTEFNQQAGRAGRDGAPAAIHLLFGESDRRINDYIIDQGAPTLGVLRELYRGMRGMARDAVVRLTYAEIARTLDFDKANERTIATAVKIFEDERLVESGIDEDGRFVRFIPVEGKIDLSHNERFAEGEAERENFDRFCRLVLGAGRATLERIVNRPIYPERVDLVR